MAYLQGGPREQEPQAEKEPPATRVEVAPGEQTYLVQRGDALERVVAKLFDSRDRKYLRAVLKANPVVAKRGGHLMSGETIIIPDLGAVPAATRVANAKGARPGSADRSSTNASGGKKSPAKRDARPAKPAAAPRSAVTRAGTSSRGTSDAPRRDERRRKPRSPAT
jgi:phage tail protein X